MPTAKNTALTVNSPQALLGVVNTLIAKINDYDRALRGKKAVPTLSIQIYYKQPFFVLRNYTNQDTQPFTDELKKMCADAGLAVVEEHARWGIDVKSLTRDKLTSLIRAVAAKTASLAEQNSNQDITKKAAKLATYVDAMIQKTAEGPEEVQTLVEFLIEESKALRGDGKKINFTWSGRNEQLHNKAAQLARTIDHDVEEMGDQERVAFVGRIFTASGAMQTYAATKRDARSDLGNNFVAKYQAEALFSGQSPGEPIR